MSQARPRFMGPGLGNQPLARESFVSASTNPYPAGADNDSVYALNPPAANTYRDDPNASYVDMNDSFNPNSISRLGPPSGGRDHLQEKRQVYADPRQKSKRTLTKVGLILGGFVLVVAVAGVIIYFVAIKPSQNKSSKNIGDGASTPDASSTSGAPPTATGKPTTNNVVTGGDGSKVTTDSGDTFTYSNSFGGYWYFDPNDPLNNGAKAQSWTPALNETFRFGIDRIWGVNLGGWLTTEPFISPALYEKYLNGNPVAVDEWTLSQNMRADTSPGGGIQQLEQHYKTFITEEDFAQIAGAGLNFVRIPLPYWCIETRGDEPFLPKTCWTYFLKGVEWARKYGLRINLDLHALPGSQNGWNHSGRLGTVNLLNGPMGIANAQRALDYIRILAEFISQPQYRDVIPYFGIMNEPQAPVVGQDQLSAFYVQAYNVVRNAGGTGAGNGPYVSFHDGFLGLDQWATFLPGADRAALDQHPYLCFSTQSSSPLSSFIQTPCTAWGASFNTSLATFGLTAAGEFSNAINDCGLYVNGVNLGTRFEGTYPGSWPRIGDCTPFTDYNNWDATTKSQYMQLAQSSMDALQNWFFWTWKIGNSSVTGDVEAPQWSYQLGLQKGWMPKDPRSAVGACGNTNPFLGALKPAQTGGAGAGNIPAAATATLVWPPASISGGGAVSTLPTYTPTAALVTLPVPTFTAQSGKNIPVGDGWQNAADQVPMMTDIAGCSYLDPWVGEADPPSPLCTAKSRFKRVPAPQITSPPS